jgi:hypothetical protein
LNASLDIVHIIFNTFMFNEIFGRTSLKEIIVS